MDLPDRFVDQEEAAQQHDKAGKIKLCHLYGILFSFLGEQPAKTHQQQAS